jgi:hypothetical protein
MDEKKEPEETRIVRDWVNRNASEFKENGKRLYRDNVFSRCERYIGAPNEFLQTKLKILPENIKWYFTLFQGVFIAGTVGIATTLFFLFMNNLLAWLPFQANLNHIDFLNLRWLTWFVPLILFVGIIISALKKSKNVESSVLSHFIQTRFWVLTNLKDLEIEMYYVSVVLKMQGNLPAKKQEN